MIFICIEKQNTISISNGSEVSNKYKLLEWNLVRPFIQNKLVNEFQYQQLLCKTEHLNREQAIEKNLKNFSLDTPNVKSEIRNFYIV